MDNVVTAPWESEQIITCRDESVGLRAVIAIDNTTLGPGFGGVRFRPYPSTEAAAREAQRLAAAMTLKHALADLPYGGGKSVIIAEEGRVLDADARRALMARYGEFVARTAGSYIPGVDMGTTPDDMQVIRDLGGARAFCDEVDPGPYTARGVYAAMRAGVRHALDRDMAGVRVVVQGAGHVGSALASFAAGDGAEVTVCDVDTVRAEQVAVQVGGRVGDPAEAPYADCDVFAPCAVARVVTDAGVDRIRARVIAGAANDTLDAPEVADLLQGAGVTYVPDFVANAGGVIQVHAGQAGWSAAELDAKLEEIGDRVESILAEADAEQVNPVRAALRRADRTLGG